MSPFFYYFYMTDPKTQYTYDHPFDSGVGRKWIKDHLQLGPMHVTFTKKDGTERTMRCTLKEDLTVQYDKKTDRSKTSNSDVCPVFDLDKQEWRSFRFDSVTRVQFDL